MAKYDANRVQSHRSYKIRDICQLYGDKNLHPQTVRNWYRKEKLEVFYYGNVIFVYGAILKRFLKDRNNKFKQPLAFNELKCWKCKAVSAPLDNMIMEIIRLSNGALKAIGICPECGGESSHIYAHNAGKEILECFRVVQSALRVLSDCLPSHRKTHPEKRRKIVEGECAQESSNSLKKTHLEEEQLELAL